jgi:hypothetical protein
MTTARQIDELKSEGRYFEAGKLARELGRDDNYGCHFGLRSELEKARAEFKLGFNAEDTVAVWPRGYAHEDGTSKIKVPAGTLEADVARIVRKQFGSFASISGITRARPPVAPVSDADARHYSRHDNT